MTRGSAWGRAAYGRSVRAVRQSGPSERSLVRLNRGKNSFLSDPPNADISIFEAGRLRQFIVVLRDPVLRGTA